MLALKKPIENCYWVVPGKILAGEYPRNLEESSSRKKIKRLLNAGVELFIDLTEHDEGLSPYEDMLCGSASHRRHPIKDVSVPESPKTTLTILNEIDEANRDGKLIYIHCWGGIGRTGLIVGCWLARHGHLGKEALSHLRMLWQNCPKSAFRKSPETSEQESYILAWKEE